MYDHGGERMVNWLKTRFLLVRLRFFLSGGEEAWVVGSVTAVLSVISCMLSSCAMIVLFLDQTAKEGRQKRRALQSFGTKMPGGGQFERRC